MADFVSELRKIYESKATEVINNLVDFNYLVDILSIIAVKGVCKDSNLSNLKLYLNSYGTNEVDRNSENILPAIKVKFNNHIGYLLKEKLIDGIYDNSEAISEKVYLTEKGKILYILLQDKVFKEKLEKMFSDNILISTDFIFNIAEQYLYNKYFGC